MSEDLAFERSGDGKRYRALLGGEEAGFAEVDPIGTDGLLIKHTEVSNAFEGRGIAGKLVRFILEDARHEGRGVVPICPYARAYILRHPEFMDYVRESFRASMR